MEVPVGEFLSSPQEMMLIVSMFQLQVLDQFSEILILPDSTWIGITISNQKTKNFYE